MKKIDFALICAIVVGVFYACSEDYFAPYAENLELNANDPRLELIAEIDSTKRKRENVEKLSIGENTVNVNQQIILSKEFKFYKYDYSTHISMPVTVLVTTDSVTNFIYPTFYQEVQGYPVNVNVTIPSSVGSGIHWTYSSSRATIVSPKVIRLEVRGIFHDYMGFFQKDVAENVHIDVAANLTLQNML